MNELYDVVIIGAGPAGISAYIWARELKMRVKVLDPGDSKCSQLLNIHNRLANYPGIIAANGADFRDRFLAGVNIAEADLELFSPVDSIERNDAVYRLSRRGKPTFEARAVVIATGVRRRELAVDRAENSQVIILESGVRQSSEMKGKRVVVMGGGDAAAENALLIAKHADEVSLVHRRDRLSARAEFGERVADHPRIRVHLDSTVTRVAEHSVEIKSNGRTSSIAADAMIARIGYVPNTEPFEQLVELDRAGYVVVDATGRSSQPGIYAAGDCANPISPTIATAVGTGATSIKAIFALLSGQANV